MGLRRRLAVATSRLGGCVLLAACAPVDKPPDRAARPVASAPIPSPSTSAAPSASASSEAPVAVDAIATNRFGHVQSLFDGNPMLDCLEGAAGGDRGTLIVTAGASGWAEPEMEIDGLPMPLVRCLMGHVTEALASRPLTAEWVVYVTVQ